MAMQPQIKKLSPLIPFFNGEPSSVSVASEETGSLSSEDTFNNASQSWDLNISDSSSEEEEPVTVAAYGCIISAEVYCAALTLNTEAEMIHVMITIMKHATTIRVFD